LRIKEQETHLTLQEHDDDDGDDDACMLHVYSTFIFLHFLVAISLIVSSHQNYFVTSFSVDRIER